MSIPPVSTAIKRQVKALANQDRPPLHGLRGSAAIGLIEAGYKRPQIPAVAGQTLEMIGYDDRYYQSDNLAKATLLKLESKS